MKPEDFFPPQAQPQSPDATADLIREISLKNLQQPGLKCLEATSTISGDECVLDSSVQPRVQGVNG